MFENKDSNQAKTHFQMKNEEIKIPNFPKLDSAKEVNKEGFIENFTKSFSRSQTMQYATFFVAGSIIVFGLFSFLSRSSTDETAKKEPFHWLNNNGSSRFIRFNIRTLAFAAYLGIYYGVVGGLPALTLRHALAFFVPLTFGSLQLVGSFINAFRDFGPKERRIFSSFSEAYTKVFGFNGHTFVLFLRSFYW